MKVTAYFRNYENGATKGFANLVVDGSVCINDVRLVEGSNGAFVSMPQRKVGDEYRDVVTGVSKEFASQTLEAILAAKESNENHASVGEMGKPYFDPHVNAIKDPQGSAKALASLTVRESADAEKSSFTINDIRVIQGEKNLFLGMPAEKTNSEEYPYNEFCSFTKGSQDFLSGLIISKAMDVLGIEKKTALEDKVKEAQKTKAEKDAKAKETKTKEAAKNKTTDSKNSKSKEKKEKESER